MSAYPTWSAGQRVTAALLTAGLVQSVTRSSDATGRTNNTMTNDDVLSLAVEANATYELRAWLGFNGGTTGDFRVGWSIPSGATLNWTPYQQPNTNSTTVGTIITDRSGTGVSQAGGGAGGSTIMTCLAEGTLRVGSTAGSIVLQWAQDTTNATPTILKADSFIELKRRS